MPIFTLSDQRRACLACGSTAAALVPEVVHESLNILFESFRFDNVERLRHRVFLASTFWMTTTTRGHDGKEYPCKYEIQ